MKTQLLVLAVLSTMSLSAFASDNENNCNGQGRCSTGTPISASSNANAQAKAIGVGIAGAKSSATGGSVHSNIENTIKNTNQNLNANYVNSSNRNYNDNDNKNYNTNTNKQNQNQDQNQGQSQSTSNSNNAQQNVNVQGDSTVYKAQEIPVSTAIAPPSFPTSPCRIALSAGLSLMNVGISGGGSTLDTQCDLRASAQAFSAIGDNESAEYLLCSLESSKKLPKCQPKLAILNANAPVETTQTQLSSIIK